MMLLWLAWTLAVSANSLTITDLRSRCDEMTNAGVTEMQGYQVAERKPWYLFHVRRICENQESLFDEGKFPDQKKWEELNLIYLSSVERLRIEKGVSLLEILGMGFAHDISPLILRYKKQAVVEKLIEDKLYWSAPEVPLSKAFDRQWISAGVDPSFKWLRLDKLEGKGSIPKVHADDLRTGARWLLKWGDETHSDPVASRIFAGLGFNVDYPFFKSKGEFRLLLGHQGRKRRTIKQLVNFIHNSYKVNLSRLISSTGTVTDEMIQANPLLAGKLGETYLEFFGTTLEPRPAHETRLGPIMMDSLSNLQRRELRGALLAHMWIGNWDTKPANTLLTIVNQQGSTHLKGSFSDLGVSMGVKISKFPRDLKAGLVNEFAWDILSEIGSKVHFNARMNHLPLAWRTADWSDLHWMARQIARMTSDDVKEILLESGWPANIQQLYLFKLAERRQQILKTFAISDPHPWPSNRKYQDLPEIVEGQLTREPNLSLYPQGLWHTTGRFRGYGW
jgi:hypothetical protein